MAEPRGKQEMRERVWRAMEIHGAARFPGAKGRIPNFAGAERAALQLQSLPEWRRARVVKINPDAPQLPVRRLALREGKLVYMAVPRLRSEEPFLELDPARLGTRGAKAATIKGATVHGRPVNLDNMRPIDLVVCGSVVVNGRGGRLGKGGGYSDIEYGLLRAHGLINERTTMVTTVHPLQIVPHQLPRLPHDITLDWIVTPDGLLRCARGLPRPRGIYWDYLDDDAIAAIPVLGEFNRARQAR
jgi:5-formyltetrahydrofolate cyclo-ligase